MAQYKDIDAILRQLDEYYITAIVQQKHDDVPEDHKKHWKGVQSGINYARNTILEAPTVNPYEWISVNDDKPKKNDYYLCWRMTSKCGDKEEWKIDKLYWEDNLWLMHHNSFKVVDYVTYWMPLPTPPKN